MQIIQNNSIPTVFDGYGNLHDNHLLVLLLIAFVAHNCTFLQKTFENIVLDDKGEHAIFPFYHFIQYWKTEYNSANSY